MPTGITAVTNLGPGRGRRRRGADRGDHAPGARSSCKIRDRAVTGDDYEFLAREATNDVPDQPLPGAAPADAPRAGEPAGVAQGRPVDLRRHRPRPRNRQPGRRAGPGRGRWPGRSRPRTRSGWCRAYLEQRRDLTAHLEVLGPRYLPVIVSVEVVIWQQAIERRSGPEQGEGGHAATGSARFLHPTRGGPGDRDGGSASPSSPRICSGRSCPPEDLGYISSLQVQPDIPAYHFPPISPGGTSGNFRDELERPFTAVALGRLGPPGRLRAGLRGRRRHTCHHRSCSPSERRGEEPRWPTRAATCGTCRRCSGRTTAARRPSSPWAAVPADLREGPDRHRTTTSPRPRGRLRTA